VRRPPAAPRSLSCRHVPLLTPEESRELVVLDTTADAEVVNDEFETRISDIYLGAKTAPASIPYESLQSVVLFGDLEGPRVEGSSAVHFVFPGADGRCSSGGVILCRSRGRASHRQPEAENQESKSQQESATHGSLGDEMCPNRVRRR
jgi:hypothetical protein